MIPVGQLDRSKTYLAERRVIALAQSAGAITLALGRLPRNKSLPALFRRIEQRGPREFEKYAAVFMWLKNTDNHRLAYLMALAVLYQIDRRRGLKTAIDLANACKLDESA